MYVTRGVSIIYERFRKTENEVIFLIYRSFDVCISIFRDMVNATNILDVVHVLE